MRALSLVGLLLFGTSFGGAYDVPRRPEVVELTFDTSMPNDPPTARHNTSDSPPPFVEAETNATPPPPPTIPEVIAASAIEFGQDPGILTRVAFCESSFRPAIVGDGGLAVGLF